SLLDRDLDRFGAVIRPVIVRAEDSHLMDGYCRYHVLMKRGIKHANELKGFAFLEVLSPCVTYNDTYKEWREQVYDLESEQGYDPKNRLLAYTRVSELNAKGKLATGLIYTGLSKSLEETSLESRDPLALQDITSGKYLPQYEELLKDFR
ncbi:MAG: hypothetical protein M1305_07760, partial [Candidatus Marsarchaeota archaeon]|nr:hypothetical protein [Candidatus Marsarchaeota archaeon]